MGFVSSLLLRRRRRVVRDTWELIDAKLGAFVRGQLHPADEDTPAVLFAKESRG